MAERLSAAELGITDREHEALLWVRNALDPAIPDIKLPAWIRFDMNTWSDLGTDVVGDRLTRCGTACCIGGSMEVYLAGLAEVPTRHVVTEQEVLAAESALLERRDGSGPFFALFYCYDNRQCTRAEAVAAIDRFFAGNTEDPWLTSAP